MPVERAEEIACRAHGDSVDRLGLPDIEHVRQVAESVSANARAVGWLHDTVEDTAVTLKQLEAAGLSPDEVDAIRLLTRDKERDATYMDGIRRIADAPGLGGWIARQVKYADNHDNRHRQAPPEMAGMRSRGGRYDRAHRIIAAAMAARGEQPPVIDP
jgi:hypothetical protein